MKSQPRKTGSEGSCLPPPKYWINSIIAELKIFYNVDFTFERKEVGNEFAY